MNIANAAWDDVLVLLMEEDPKPNYSTLLVWQARFPLFHQDLTEYFAVWAEQEAMATPAALDLQRLRNQAVSRALNQAHLAKQESSNPSGESASRLSLVARAHGMNDATLAIHCGLDESMIVKLDRRRIQPFESIPWRCLLRIGQALNESRVRIEEMISGPPLQAAAGGLRKARTKAEMPTETFEDAIRASTLSATDQEYWLALARATGDRG